MIRLILFGFLVVAVTVGAARAQTLPGINTSRQFRIERLPGNHTRLTGAVELDGGDWQFYAEQVDIFSDESRLVASGNVVFTSEGGRIAAERRGLHPARRGYRAQHVRHPGAGDAIPRRDH